MIVPYVKYKTGRGGVYLVGDTGDVIDVAPQRYPARRAVLPVMLRHVLQALPEKKLADETKSPSLTENGFQLPPVSGLGRGPKESWSAAQAEGICEI